jgi:branched-chain amino acid aminotransferase
LFHGLGTGAYKLGVNYAPGVVAQRDAAKLGYVQNLWLHGPEHYLTEVLINSLLLRVFAYDVVSQVGTMNLFVVFKQSDSSLELVTPPLDGMILPGVTRDSVLALARSPASHTASIPNLPSNLTVSERPVTMAEVKAASAEGRLVELFGAGTAAVISPVDRIGYMGEDVLIPTGPDGMGPVSRPIWEELVGRQTGGIKSDWSVLVSE